MGDRRHRDGMRWRFMVVGDACDDDFGIYPMELT